MTDEDPRQRLLLRQVAIRIESAQVMLQEAGDLVELARGDGVDVTAVQTVVDAAQRHLVTALRELGPKHHH